MKRSRKILLSAAVGLVLLLVTACLSMLPYLRSREGGTSKYLQDDLDKIRLNDIQWLHEKIEEYRAAKGHYPYELESQEIPRVVLFQTTEQEKRQQGNVPIFVDLDTRSVEGVTPVAPRTIERITPREFYDELATVVSGPLYWKFDPQRVPIRKPCIYVYTVYMGVFDVTGFLHNELGFTRPISPYNNKITLTSTTVPRLKSGLRRVDDLRSDPDYIEFTRSPMNKPGYERRFMRRYEPGSEFPAKLE